MKRKDNYRRHNDRKGPSRIYQSGYRLNQIFRDLFLRLKNTSQKPTHLSWTSFPIEIHSFLQQTLTIYLLNTWHCQHKRHLNHAHWPQQVHGQAVERHANKSLRHQDTELDTRGSPCPQGTYIKEESLHHQAVIIPGVSNNTICAAQIAKWQKLVLKKCYKLKRDFLAEEIRRPNGSLKQELKLIVSKHHMTLHKYFHMSIFTCN